MRRMVRKKSFFWKTEKKTSVFQKSQDSLIETQSTSCYVNIRKSMTRMIACKACKESVPRPKMSNPMLIPLNACLSSPCTSDKFEVDIGVKSTK